MFYFVVEMIEVVIGSLYCWLYVFCVVFLVLKIMNLEKVFVIFCIFFVVLILRLFLDNGGFW